MQMKSILFGFGMALVLLSAVVLVAYRFDHRQSEIALDEAILMQAAEMGMVWPTEDVAEVVRKALEMGMVFEDDDLQGENDAQYENEE